MLADGFFDFLNGQLLIIASGKIRIVIVIL